MGHPHSGHKFRVYDPCRPADLSHPPTPNEPGNRLSPEHRLTIKKRGVARVHPSGLRADITSVEETITLAFSPEKNFSKLVVHFPTAAHCALLNSSSDYVDIDVPPHPASGFSNLSAQPGSLAPMVMQPTSDLRDSLASDTDDHHQRQNPCLYQEGVSSRHALVSSSACRSRMPLTATRVRWESTTTPVSSGAHAIPPRPLFPLSFCPFCFYVCSHTKHLTVTSIQTLARLRVAIASDPPACTSNPCTTCPGERATTSICLASCLVPGFVMFCFFNWIFP